MSSRRKIFKNSAILFFQSAFSVLISVFINGYIARKLGTSDYGKFVFAFSFATMFNIFSDMGFYGWGVKEIARDRARTAEILGDLIVVRTLLSVATFLVVCIIINFLDYPVLTRTAIYIAAASVILCGTQFTNAWIVFEALERVKYEGLSNIICRIIVAALSLYLMYFGYGIISLSLAYLFGSFIQIVYCYYILRVGFDWPKIRFAPSRYLEQARQALPFAFLGFFFVIYYEIDKTMLSLMKGDSAVGLYNAATSIAYKGAIISTAISIACLPAMIRSYKNSKKELSRFVSKLLPFLLIIGLPIAGIGTVFAGEIIHIIYGSVSYQPAIITLQLIIWMIPLEFLNHFMRFALIAANKEKVPAYTTGFGLLINIILNLYLIGKYSYNGAAAATVVTEICLVTFQLVYFHNRINSVSVGLKSVSVIIANVLFIYILSWLKVNFSFWGILVAAPVYVGVLLLLKVVSADYLELLRNIFIKRTA